MSVLGTVAVSRTGSRVIRSKSANAQLSCNLACQVLVHAEGNNAGLQPGTPPTSMLDIACMAFWGLNRPVGWERGEHGLGDKV